MNRPGKIRKVVLLLNIASKSDRDRLHGIMRYASTAGNWETYILRTLPHLSPTVMIPPAECDGLIAYDNIYRSQPEWSEVRPAVIFDLSSDPPRRTRGLEILNCDNAALARLAAQFFLSRGFANFAFVSTVSRRKWADERLESFRKTLARHDKTVHAYESPTDGSNTFFDDNDRLRDWIIALPKPCAVFAAFDQRAEQIVRICRLANIGIPDQVSVLGVDNDEFICEYSHPTISSIQPDFEVSGYRSAERLDRMMSGLASQRTHWKYGNSGIVERESTFDAKGGVRILSTARDYIRRNALNGISVSDVAKAAGVSVRTLQKRFLQSTDSTPLAEINKLKLKKACQLLGHTHTPIDNIGKLCGFSSEAHMKTLFRKTFSMTMREYRRNQLGRS